MIEIEAQVKRWGRSFGIIIPMEKIREANIVENEKVRITLNKKRNPFIETFGILKGKIKSSTKKIMEEINKEGWDE